MSYGIKTNGKYKFEDLPTTDEIFNRMNETKSFNFAIINISKYSNDSVTGANADIELMDRFLKDSELEKRNFIFEEIELLDPDIIITANLWNGKIDQNILDFIFVPQKFTNQKQFSNVASYSDFSLSGKTVKFIDLYHFSARKSDEEYYYNPIIKLLFE